MPKTKTSKLNKREQLDQRNTHDITTPRMSVQASPINALKRKDVSSRGLALAQALDSYTPTLNLAQQYYEQNADLQINEGAYKAQSGEEKPTEGQFLIKGYERAEGKLHAAQYRKEVNEFLLNNYNKLDPKEFDVELASISQKYIDNAPSEDYLKSFLPVAQQEEDKVTMKYQEVVAKSFQEESRQMVSQMVNDDMTNIVLDSLDLYSVEDLDAVMEDEQEYLKLLGRIEGSDIDVALRASLTEIQDTAEGMNLDKQTVSNLLVQQVGQIAEDYGLPELMDFASLPDESDIKLETNPELLNVIEGYRERAQVKQDRTLELQEVSAEKKQKEKEDRFINKTVFAINDISVLQNPTEKANAAEELRKELLNNPEYKDLPPSTVSTLDRNLTKMMLGEDTFRQVSNQTVYSEMMDKVYNGELTDVEVMENMDNLSQTDFKFFLNFIDNLEREAAQKKEQEEALKARKKAAEEEAIADAKAEREAEIEAQREELEKNIDNVNSKYWGTTKKNVIDYLAKKIGTDTWTNPEQKAAMETLFQTWETQYLLNNNFKFPTVQETNEMFNDYLKTSDAEVTSVNQLQSKAFGGEELTREESYQGDLQAKENEAEVSKAQLETTEEPKTYNFSKDGIVGGLSITPKNEQREELEKTSGSYQLPREKVYENFFNGLESGASYDEIINAGVKQNVFKTPEEGYDYAAAYALGYAETILRNQGVIYADEVVELLQKQGLNEEGALQVVRQAIKLLE